MSALLFDPSTDFTSGIFDFQEAVTYFPRTGQGTVGQGIPLTNVTRQTTEEGTTGEGRTVQLRRLRFFAGEDLSVGMVIFELPVSQLQGNTPFRKDVIKDAAGIEYYVRYTEVPNDCLGKIACACTIDPESDL